MRCLSGIALLALSQFGFASVVVEESKIRAVQREGRTEIVLPVKSTEQRTVSVTVALEWLDTADHETGTASRDVRIAPGETTVAIPMPLVDGSIWTRLRYSVTPVRAEAAAFSRQRGTVPLARIADFVFEAQASLTGVVRQGRSLLVHAQALHPVTRQPVEGVQWQGVLSSGDQEWTATEVTSLGSGVVAVRFAALREADEDGKVALTAARGDFEQSVSIGFDMPREFSAQLQSDKPIYQPGQTMHLRAVVLNPEGRAAAGAKVTLRVEDGEGERAFTRKLTASRFGVVHADYVLPASAEIGRYSVELVLDDEDEEIGRHAVRVSRYDLPSFRVEARSERAAYVASDQVKVVVSAQYLFGKPVPKGRVKIVRASGDETVAEGETAADGTYQAVLNLAEEHQQLTELTAGGRFADVPFAVYVSDPQSGRTEQRKFDVRITRELLHVYLLTAREAGVGYISTYTADGKPVAAKVEVRFGGKTERVETNRYGVARVNLSTGGDQAILRAVDSAGRVGTAREWVSQRSPAAVRVLPRKTVHAAGEAVTLRVTSTTGATQIVVHAVADGERVASRVVPILAGSGEVTFPYQVDFRRTVMFVAEGEGRAVIFPDASDLRITAAPERLSYKPGEMASVEVRVLNAAQRPVAAALGVSIVDEAVMERARSDEEFGARHWFSCQYCADEGEAEIGGLRLNDLYQLKIAPTAALDLAAEALVARAGVTTKSGKSEEWSSRPHFGSMETQVRIIQSRLTEHFAATLVFPRDAAALWPVVNLAALEFADPWGMPYTAAFGVRGNSYTIELRSAGPDKKQGTEDDFVAATFLNRYFLPLSRMMSDALEKEVDYPASTAELSAVMRRSGLLIEGLRDPWGTAYGTRITTWGARRRIEVLSAGPDQKMETADDVLVETFGGPYFRRERAQIEAALLTLTTPPQTREEFAKVMRTVGIDMGRLRDAWGNAYRLESTIRSEYADRSNTRTVQEFGQEARSVTVNTPVTRKVNTFSIRSSGADGAAGTYDDFDLARFPVILQTETASPATVGVAGPVGRPGTGKVSGVVTDPSGAVVPGATVVLVDGAMQGFETRSGNDGSFHFIGVPAGLYLIRAEMQGFQRFELLRVPVSEDRTTRADVMLQVGSVAETVAVEAAPPSLETSMSQSASAGPVASTPRVRDYFPETLLWLADVETDENGRVRIPVQLADNITNWKVAVVASTVNGQSAMGSGDIRAFQPFFLDFDPPAVLTVGDQIELPVTVRNYEARSLRVRAGLETGDWARSDASMRELTIAANGADTVAFPLTAVQGRATAKARLTARAGKLGDAIEKPIQVRPDGQLHTHTQSDLLTDGTTLGLTIPEAGIRDASRGELRIYPNFAALLLEGAEAILVTPHGCAEQITSAGYANLIAWRFARAAGIHDPRIEASALANVRAAVEGVADRIGADGGVGYWSRGEADVAVTAHVMQFLLEASAYTPVDPGKVASMAQWLADTQVDGRWKGRNEQQTLLLTSMAARALAAAKKAGMATPGDTMRSAYRELAQFTSGVDEPYALSQYVLALLDSGQDAGLDSAVARLAALARSERGGLYWDMQSNTPFYGWGTAGRMETTGLAVSALAGWRARHPEATAIDAAMRGGLAFLLRGRDRWGAWHSTQATLRAMRAVADVATVEGVAMDRHGDTLALQVNGTALPAVSLTGGDPVLVDLSAHLKTGENRVELRGGAGALLRMTTSHWVPWEKAAERRHSELRFAVQFDRLSANVGELVRCSVRVERVGFRGYGMMLAEVALPPGVEVDRASLERLPVSRYDVLPDRVIFYVWPSAGGVAFDFYVRPRMRITAKSGASLLYDYYNPEAAVEVPPMRWVIR